MEDLGHLPLLSLLGLVVAGALAGCGPTERSGGPQPGAAAAASAPSPVRITVQLDWVPEPEHGGFFQAQARGWFAEEGLDVVLLPGGPNAFGLQKTATGQADLAQADSTNVLVAIAEGLPLVHVAAVFQNDPSVLMLHADNPVQRFEDLAGRTIMARPEWAFLPFLRRRYGIDFNLIPQNFQVANFVADPNFIQQGFYIAEPWHILRGGAKMPRFLYVWDAGFDAYTVLFANRDFVRRQPAALRAFLRTYIRGWNDYLFGDPNPGQAALKQANPNNSDDFLAWSRQMIIDERLVIGRGPEGGPEQIGRIEAARFARQIRQLEELGIIPAGRLATEDVLTTEFLP